MSERFSWFNKDRRKQNLMSEVLEIAGQAIERLSLNNFEYTDSSGEVRIKKEFGWLEFVPKDNNNKNLLEKTEVLEALGIGPDAVIKEASDRQHIKEREVRGIWPTLVPGLNYIKIRNLITNLEDDYFQIDSGSNKENRSGSEINKNETHVKWNQRMWSQPDADKKAKEELDVLGNQYPDLPK